MNKIAVATALLCSCGTALAQEVVINPSWYIQPSIGGWKPDDRTGTDKEDWAGGLKFGKPIHRMWDIQVGATYGKSDDDLTEYEHTTLGVDALLMLSRKRFRPFVLFGVGVQHDKIDRPLFKVSNNSPYISAGFGVQLDFTDQWSMQADLRSVRGYLQDDEEFGFKHTNNKYFMVGLNYAFSKPPAPPPPPAPPEPPPPPPAPVEPPPPPPPPPKFEKVTMSATELFGFNSATLTMPQPKLDEIAAAMAADPSITDVDITGYADRLGKAAYNLKLSQRRADAVRNYLVSKGIDGSRMRAIGRGEENPVVQCNQKKRAELIKCLEPNRRVEVEQISIERRMPGGS